MDMQLMPRPDARNMTPTRGWSQSAHGRKRNRQLADLGAIASHLAHEIRNPLNSMRLQATVVARKLAKGDAADMEVAGQQLAALQGEIDRLEKLAESFLTYGRPPDGAPERIRLSEFLAGLEQMLAPECESRNVELTVSVSPASRDANVFMDRSQLEQVLLNLTRNANDAMEQGGTLGIRLRKRGGTRAAISLVDTGCGIPHEKMATIFEPFFSTRGNGSGLGLPIARQIIEAAGGYIRVKSEVNKGSHFEVILPLASSPASAEC